MECNKKLANYKKNVLGVNQAGIFKYKGKEYLKDYILPKEQSKLNFMIDDNSHKFLSKNLIQLDKNYDDKPIQIRLHRYWHHLNSSQILSLNYFYDFIENLEKLNKLLKFLGINELAHEATLEYGIYDKTEVDFVIKLKSGKFVYIEVKYSEKEFGPASSKTTDYKKRKEQFYSKADIGFNNFKKHYQFIRNVILGVDGNYSVFLVPMFNDKIIKDYYKAVESLKNFNDFSVSLVKWEDLLKVVADDAIEYKYFKDVTMI